MVDERLVSAPASAAEALRALPSGVYTTVVIVGGRAEAWADHIARLRGSLSHLQEQQQQLSGQNSITAPLATVDTTQAQEVDASLAQRIAPSLALALSAAHGGCEAQQAVSDGRQMATILLCPPTFGGYDFAIVHDS